MLKRFDCDIILLMKCIFIYNPKSGKGKIAKKIDYIKSRLQEKYEEVDVYATKEAGDLTVKVREIADQYDCIVFSGGDGTFNEVLQGLGERETLPTLGYIPGGTANDVAHSLKIPRKSVKGAIKVILEGKRELLDCMRINGNEYAMYSVSAGAFTSATYTTSQNSKKKLGWLAYGLQGIKKNFPLPVFSVEATSGEQTLKTECVFTLVANGKCVAGMKMNPRGSMQDGVMECAIVKQRNKPNVFRRIGAFFSLIGLFLFGYSAKARGVAKIRGEKFTFDVSDEVVWNFDGEKGPSGKIEIELIKSKVPLLVPKNNKNI